ncbi:MAG: hypothetical protein WBA57_25170 [Elainellaceae cyanobacterium]
MTSIKVNHQERIKIGNIETVVYQRPDHSYLIDIRPIAKTLDVDLRRLAAFLSEATNARRGDGSGVPMIEEVIVSSQHKKVEKGWGITPEGMIAFLQWQVEQGNKNALTLLADICFVGMTQFLDQIFENSFPGGEDTQISKTEVDNLKEFSESEYAHHPVWQAYSDSKREREEVYRRLANS